MIGIPNRDTNKGTIVTVVRDPEKATIGIPWDSKKDTSFPSPSTSVTISKRALKCLFYNTSKQIFFRDPEIATIGTLGILRDSKKGTMGTLAPSLSSTVLKGSPILSLIPRHPYYCPPLLECLGPKGLRTPQIRFKL